MTMLETDRGRNYAPKDVRIIPGGFSSSLNGGLLVNAADTLWHLMNKKSARCIQ